MDMNDFFAMGFCKAAEEHGVDPVQLAKYAQQQLPMSSYNQRRIAEMKALAAKLKGGTSPNVTTNADGSVTSKWKGTFRGGELVQPTLATQPQPTALADARDLSEWEKLGPHASESQHQPVAPVQKATPSAPTAPTPANKPEVRINNTLF